MFEGVRRYIGLQFDGTTFVPTGEDVELADMEFKSEYLLAMKAGDLVPADAETARMAGLPYPAAEPEKD
jgi:hypothetical protein